MVLLGSVALVDVLLVALMGLVADVPLQKDTATAEAAEGEEGTQVAPCQLAVVLEVASVVPDPAWLLVAAFGTYPFLFVELLALSPLAQVTAEVAAEHPVWALGGGGLSGCLGADAAAAGGGGKFSGCFGAGACSGCVGGG